MDVQRFLIGLGLVILVAGIMWPILSRIGLGRLPGDIMFQRGGATFYFPLVTCIIISIVLSALLWLFAWGDGGYEAAVRDAKAASGAAFLVDVKADTTYTNVVLGLYQHECTKVTARIPAAVASAPGSKAQ